MVDTVEGMQNCDNWLQQLACKFFHWNGQLTPDRMIQIIVVSALLITMEQNRDATAPSRVIDRRPSWVPRAPLIHFFTLGFIGVCAGFFSRLSHYIHA
jgi:hypothetical protein